MRGWRRGVLGRAKVVWAIFWVALVATGFAVYRLYDTVQREFEAQSRAAMTQELGQAAARVQARTDALRHRIIKTLAGFHSEGLGHALRKWDAADAMVTGTFEWEEGREFLPAEASEKAGAVPAAWKRFRGEGRAGDGVEMFRLRDNPAFPAAELGYQAENLEMLSYAGRAADPWASWLVSSCSTWVFSYQAGPGAPVRGCFVEVERIVAQLRDEFSDLRMARIELVPQGRYSDSQPAVAHTKAIPCYALVAEPGTLFTEKRNAARLSAAGAVGLLGLFLLGATFLAIHAQREVVEAERKATFVTQVSHELRTPLTSIRVFADMLAAPEVSAEKRTKFAGTISRESERLGALIERLLAFTALEKGKQPVSLEIVEVGAVVRETLEEMEPVLRAAGMRVELEGADENALARTDRGILKQALVNLLDNARKYAAAGGVVTVTVRCDRSEVRVAVADAGPGIPRGMRERVFEPFVQGGVGLTDKSPGVGLGLSLARGTLRAAGAELVLVSSEIGAAFEIRLPRAAATAVTSQHA